MALQKEIADPTGVSTISEAYIRIVEVNVNFADEAGRIVLNVYRDAASRTANKPPVTQIAYSVSRSGRAAAAAVLDGEGNVVTPAVIAFPSFAQLIAACQTEYDALKAALYALVKTQSELTGSEDV